jgi:uncharacterized protein
VASAPVPHGINRRHREAPILSAHPALTERHVTVRTMTGGLSDATCKAVEVHPESPKPVRTSPWVEEMRAVLRGARSAAVPCGTCTACCTSSQFVLIEADETEAIAHIPAPLRFPAPRRPGSFVLGYDKNGRCPMLVNEACSIYEHRPRTCRAYDCRVFAAAGLADDVDGKAMISTAAQAWRFDPVVSTQLQAIRAAATYLLEHQAELGDVLPATVTHLAVLAFEIHELWLRGSPDVLVVRERITTAIDSRAAPTQ